MKVFITTDITKFMTTEKQQSSTAGTSVRITVEVDLSPKPLGAGVRNIVEAKMPPKQAVVNMLIKVGQRLIPYLIMYAANSLNQPKIDHPQLPPPPIEHQDQ
jgi:hypothetical protein